MGVEKKRKEKKRKAKAPAQGNGNKESEGRVRTAYRHCSREQRQRWARVRRGERRQKLGRPLPSSEHARGAPVSSSLVSVLHGDDEPAPHRRAPQNTEHHTSDSVTRPPYPAAISPRARCCQYDHDVQINPRH